MAKLLLVLALSACSGSSVQTDAGSGSDAAGPGRDAMLGTDDAARDDGGPPPPRPDAGPIMAHPMLADLGDSSLRSLGEIDCTNPEGESDGSCRIATDFSGMTYDSVNHRMYVFGGGHASTMTDALQVLDLRDTLRWSDLYTPTPCSSLVETNLDDTYGAWLSGPSGPYPRPVSAHTYDLIGFAPVQNQFVLLGRAFTQGYCTTVSNYIGGPSVQLDLGSETWMFSSDERSRVMSNALPASERDPVSGLFIVLGGDGLFVYDAATRMVVAESATLRTSSGGTFDQEAELGYANHMVYYPPTDRMYYFVRGAPVKVFEVILDRTDFTRSTVDEIITTGPSSPHDEPGYDYDSRNRIIGGGVTGDRFYAFDPQTRAWTSEAMSGGSPGNQAFHAIAYDPVDNVFIFRTTNETWAYRYRR